MVLKGVFENAVNKGWIRDGQNPLTRSVFSPKDMKTHQVQHHPFSFWEQLPEFFEVFERNEPNGLVLNPWCLLADRHDWFAGGCDFRDEVGGG